MGAMEHVRLGLPPTEPPAARAVYDAAVLQRPGALERARALVAAGERARIVPRVPARLEIIGDRATVGTADVADPQVVSALRAVFDDAWERGVPLRRAGTAPDRELLALIASGLKDEAIAHRLGMSPRTLRRRVAHLMGALGAHTRFQAGYLVARKGWL